MKSKKTTFLCLVILFCCKVYSSEIKNIKYIPDKIITVNCAHGIATIIEVPDRPDSVVIGDQDAFKVEYLDQAVTIKPLRSGATTNLYIYTDWRRYNVKLVTGPQSIADYVVYLENPKSKRKNQENITWRVFENHLNNEEFKLTAQRLGRTKDGVLLLEFEITTTAKTTLEPEWLWVTQEAEVKPIHNLALSSLEIDPDKPVRGMMQILTKDIDSTKPLRIELRRKKISYFTIPKVSQWKK
jgi:hypothetical protein